MECDRHAVSLVTHLGCWVLEEAGEQGGGGVWGAGSVREEREPVGECCVPVKGLHEKQMATSNTRCLTAKNRNR